MSDLVAKISEQIRGVRESGDIDRLQDILSTAIEGDLHWHIVCGLQEPAEETKIRLTYLSKVFWTEFLKKKPALDQVDQTVRDVLCSVINLNQFARVDPAVYGNFALWMIRDMSSHVRSVFNDYPEAQRVYDSLLFVTQHELDTPLGILANEKG